MADNFIEAYDDVLTAEECKKIIDYFEEMRSHNLIFNRVHRIEGPRHEKEDETHFLMHPDSFLLNKAHPIVGTIVNKVFDCYQQYMSKYSILSSSRNHGITSVRLQKTPIGGGYHKWHYENDGRLESHRVMAFTVYLNDVEQGGETEYLYQHLRCEAKLGRVALWPAGFTHAHRGNPPLSNEKYIATGWLEWFE
jgi:hypothetical protein